MQVKQFGAVDFIWPLSVSNMLVCVRGICIHQLYSGIFRLTCGWRLNLTILNRLVQAVIILVASSQTYCVFVSKEKKHVYL